jgi:hypothetical protein
MRFMPDTTSPQTAQSTAVASGAAATITYAADPLEYHVLDWIVWSYNSDPTAGRLTVVDTTNSDTLLDIYITAAGPGGLFFSERGIKPPKGAALTITLADGLADKTLSAQNR